MGFTECSEIPWGNRDLAPQCYTEWGFTCNATKPPMTTVAKTPAADDDDIFEVFRKRIQNATDFVNKEIESDQATLSEKLQFRF